MDSNLPARANIKMEVDNTEQKQPGYDPVKYGKDSPTHPEYNQQLYAPIEIAPRVQEEQESQDSNKSK